MQTRCMQIFERVTNETACNSMFPAHVLTSRILLQYSSKGTSSSIKGSKSSRCTYKRNIFQLFIIKHHIFCPCVNIKLHYIYEIHPQLLSKFQWNDDFPSTHHSIKYINKYKCNHAHQRSYISNN